MNTPQLIKTLQILEKEVPAYSVPVADLIQIQTKDPFKVLVAALLSARTQDQTTVKVLKKLFATVHSADDFASLSVQDIEQLIYPVGFYHNKANYLKELPDVLDKEFHGIIPEDIDDLLKLPGVGRKTANLVRAVAFNKPAICVDIHVHRIMNRFGYLTTKTPLETEMSLRKKLPEDYWIRVNYLLVAHGQNICRPTSPFCTRCGVSQYCSRMNVKTSR